MADDQFEHYYAEKLWEMIPSIYRYEDGIAAEPGVLRALVQVIANQAAILRRSQDELWDDQFIELCNEWAVPYIGDLVATRLLSALNKRGRRIDVAKTIYYRRRKGTPRILEELISDISGWEGKLVEQFEKLGRARHGLDPFPGRLAGRYSGTLPGGWADLRNPRISELADGPFEEYFHTTDVRRYNGRSGRYNIPKLAFYLYRLLAFPAVSVTPFAMPDGLSFTFDPSGRDTWLFSKRLRIDNWDEWHSALEWELPAPIPCRLLGHAEYLINEETIQTLALSAGASNELRTLSGLKFKNEASLVNIIDTFASKVEIKAHLIKLYALALATDCGKQALLPDANINLTDPLETSSIVMGFELPTNNIISVENITAANLLTWKADPNRVLSIDAENGRFKFSGAPTGRNIYVAYHYGFSGPIGAGCYHRPELAKSIANNSISGGGTIAATDLLNNGITQIEDSKTYGPIGNKPTIQKLVLQSDDYQRPYMRLEGNWTLTGAASNSILILDGLWIGAKAGLANPEIIINGDYNCVVIKNCTLDPGGVTNAAPGTINPLVLTISGDIEYLCIESCVTGPIRVIGTGVVRQFIVTDSIIQSIDATVDALLIGTGVTTLQRATVFGKVEVHRMEASEVLITEQAKVTDTQNGCFRFSAAPKGSGTTASRLPHPYESYIFTEDTHHWFTSRRFGDAGYAQLSDTAPDTIVRGGENGSEIGAFSSLLNPIKLDGLKTKVDEYMPFGLIPIYINKT
jgi:hypothetical protein